MRPPLEHRTRGFPFSDFMYTQRVGADQPTDFQFDASQGRGGVARVAARARAGAMNFQRPQYGAPLEQMTYESSDNPPLPNTEFSSSFHQRGGSNGRRMAGYSFGASGYALQQAQVQPTFVEEEEVNNHQLPSTSHQTLTAGACDGHKETLTVLVEGARNMAKVLNDFANRLDPYTK
ncbi:unnamed protein product [Meloidogyne enterolobii]|uniref:Uncharacterized protein n=1 Tax=Meloidogyne enterolobii TaxID=390850 RepID=A0ACB0Y3L2_MELEN